MRPPGLRRRIIQPRVQSSYPKVCAKGITKDKAAIWNGDGERQRKCAKWQEAEGEQCRQKKKKKPTEART